jgi:chitodextrinase
MTKPTPSKRHYHKKLINGVFKFNVWGAFAICAVLALVGYFVVKSFAATGAATLSLSPTSSIVANGATFTVQIMENSGSATVNAVQANLTYPAASLALESIDATGSSFLLVAQSTGANGTITIAQGVNGGSPAVSGSQLLATLTFKSLMTTGQASVAFAAGSAVVSSVDNTPLILTTNSGTYAPDTTPPSVPTGLQVVGSTGSSISLAWSASSDNVAVTGYNLYRDGAKVGSPVTTSFTDTGLVMGSTHSYQVTAVDAAGNESAKSASVAATVPDTTPPSVPAGVSVQAPAYNQAKVTWSASTDTGGSGLVGYRVYRDGGATALAAIAVGTLSYTDTSVVGSTAYSYTVSAYDGAGNESAKSAAVNITTPVPPDTTPPSTPGALHTTTVTLTSVALAWTASTDNVAVAGYQVYRDGTLLASPQSTIYVDASVTYGTTYQYTVKAIDPSGNVSAAATLSVTTLALKAGDLNLDNQVNVYDLSILLSAWGTSGTGLKADLNHDNSVNIFDLSILLSNWGK